MRTTTFMTLAILMAAGLNSAHDKGKRGKAPPAPPMKLTTTAFSDGGDIPVKFTCSAQPSAVSPALQWNTVPTGTVSFAMILHDPDVAMRRTPDDVVHWIWWNLPSSLTQL